MGMDSVRFLRSLGYPYLMERYLMERYLTVFFISREICLNIPSFSIHTPIPLTLLFPSDQLIYFYSRVLRRR